MDNILFFMSLPREHGVTYYKVMEHLHSYLNWNCTLCVPNERCDGATDRAAMLHMVTEESSMKGLFLKVG